MGLDFWIFEVVIVFLQPDLEHYLKPTPACYPPFLAGIRTRDHDHSLDVRKFKL